MGLYRLKNNPIFVKLSMSKGGGVATEVKTDVETKSQTVLKKPSMYKVILLNDDFTPMDFVVHVLKMFFSKSDSEAIEVMMAVHNKGAGVAGIYQYDIAEMKMSQVMNYAKKNEHPLKCVIEKE